MGGDLKTKDEVARRQSLVTKARALVVLFGIVAAAGVLLIVSLPGAPLDPASQSFGGLVLILVAFFGSMFGANLYLEPGGAVEGGRFFADRVPFTSLIRFSDYGAFGPDEVRFAERRQYPSFTVLRVAATDGRVATFNSHHQAVYEEATSLLDANGIQS